jgi:TonB family protein
MKLRVVLLAAIVVSVVPGGCRSLGSRSEIDCSRFPQSVQRDEFTPPAENEMIDTQTAEKMIVRKAYPKYPELALRAGLEGTVLVKLWIGQDGIVKQALVAKSDADIFNEASLDAARRLLFKPPSCNGKAVSVWATIPIRFKLVN